MDDRDDQPYHLSDEDVPRPYHIPDEEKKTQTRRIFEKLLQNEVVPAYVFAMEMGILQYNARIWDLRNEPYNLDIACEGERPKTQYRMLTPRNQIDFETMCLKPVEVGKTMRLL